MNQLPFLTISRILPQFSGYFSVFILLLSYSVAIFGKRWVASVFILAFASICRTAKDIITAENAGPHRATRAMSQLWSRTLSVCWCHWRVSPRCPCHTMPPTRFFLRVNQQKPTTFPQTDLSSSQSEEAASLEAINLNITCSLCRSQIEYENFQRSKIWKWVITPSNRKFPFIWS